MGGLPCSGKSTVARTLVDRFKVPASHVISSDAVRKEVLKEFNPEYSANDNVPSSALRNPMFLLEHERRVFQNLKRVLDSGNTAILHRGFMSKFQRFSLPLKISPYSYKGIWLNADLKKLRERSLERAEENRTSATSDLSVLERIFTKHADSQRPASWQEISTEHSTPEQVAEHIVRIMEQEAQPSRECFKKQRSSEPT